LSAYLPIRPKELHGQAFLVFLLGPLFYVVCTKELLALLCGAAIILFDRGAMTGMIQAGKKST
jgi:hypothetical protein